MNASMPGSCANVQGTPYAVDVALLQYVLTQAANNEGLGAAVAAGAMVGCVVISSCASISVNSLPQPGKAYSGGYDIVMQFENVLNLPERAKVVLDGTEVGVVTKVASERDMWT